VSHFFESNTGTWGFIVIIDVAGELPDPQPSLTALYINLVPSSILFTSPEESPWEQGCPLYLFAINNNFKRG